MPNKTDRETPGITHGILDYLLRNPDAEDTLEGIVDWWSLERTTSPTGSLSEAIATLVKDGLVLARVGTDSRTHYRINLKQRNKIISLLRKRS
jgi:hypothetical protein